jgi:hypothetical protein
MKPGCLPLLLCVAATALGGCNVELLREHPLGCRADEQPLVREALYFGASIPGGGDVGAADWRRFEDEVITPRFPQGYSVIEAAGKWRGADGVTRGEPSRIVVLIHEDDAASAAKVRQVAQQYRERFRQEAVLRERGAVCAAF